MSVELSERLSALVDDEVTAFERRRLIDEIADNTNERARWLRYHLIGDSLRGELPQVLAIDLVPRIRAGLHCPDVPLSFYHGDAKRPAIALCHGDAKRPAIASSANVMMRWRPLVGAAAAVLVAVLLGLVFESRSGGGHDQSQRLATPTTVVPTPAPIPVLAGGYSAIDTAKTSLPASRPAVWVDPTLNSYLVNHLEYASPRAMLPHARLVGLDAGQ